MPDPIAGASRIVAFDWRMTEDGSGWLPRSTVNAGQEDVRNLPMIMSARPFAIILVLMLAMRLQGWLGREGEAETPKESVVPGEVVVLFNKTWPDEDNNGRSDSQDVAEYYAVRRGIPADRLLGLDVSELDTKRGRLSYPEFFDRILV